ncbi:unnamed protein product [Linum tenue]|uniref:Uncharacterized protein n=1 Tax=Linum tenue TaxID=586396 RepID=A0AAV0JHS3_9ROSI|nr:unnamed protein product [Linum tenue]
MLPPGGVWEDPAAALASARHEFGEHGGVNMSIEASATFTVMEPETMRRMFAGELGMSAIASVLLQLCSSGGHVVASRELYGGTHALLSHFMEGQTKVLYFESISNPTLTVANIPELSRIAHDKGLTVVVDNTFAPMVLSPAKLGADVVVHSITKYVSGGADIIAGAYVGKVDFYY